MPAAIDDGAGLMGGAVLVVRLAPLVAEEEGFEDFLDFFFFSCLFFKDGISHGGS